MHGRSLKCSLTVLIGCLWTSEAVHAASPQQQERDLWSTESLDMRAPARAILGRDKSVEITFRMPAGEKPVLRVSTGSVSPPRETSTGRLLVVYEPPKRLYPQAAIFAVTNEEGWLLDWIALPLYGETQIDTKTEPGASVTVRIAGAAFGPVQADAAGRAAVSVLVPPGVQSGITEATDSLGNNKETSFSLDVKPFNRLLCTCPDTGDRAVLLVVDAHGKPKKRARFHLKSTAGKLSSPSELEPGVYESVLEPPDDAVVGTTVTLSATLHRDMESKTSCTMSLRKGLPASATITVDPRSHLAGRNEPISVIVELVDVDGKVAPLVPVELSSDLGELSALRRASSGKYLATWTIPRKFGGKEHATITARTQSDPVISAKATLSLRAGPVSRIEVSARETQLQADGHNTTVITATAFDAMDNRVSSARLLADSAGKMTPFTRNGLGGAYESTYIAPRYSEDTPEDTVVVRTEGGDIEASLQIELMPSTLPIAVGAKMGYATNFGEISSALFSVDVAVRPPILKERLAVGIEAFAYWNSSKQRLDGGTDNVTLSVWSIPLLVRATYQIPVDPLAIYAGVAGGVSIVGAEISSESDGRVATRGLYFAASGVIGADMRLGLGRAVLEATYLHSQSDASAVQGNLGGLLLTGGYRFEF